MDATPFSLPLRAAALLLALCAGACSTIANVPLDEAAEIATMGRERELRDPPREPRGPPRVLVFALDGVGHDDFHGALAAGELPNIARLLGASGTGDGLRLERAHSVPGVVTVLPSATTTAWASVFTGAPPAETGVPGNEWFDRQERRFLAPVPISVASRDHATRLFTDELLSDLLAAPTLYERADVRAHVSLHPVLRGADLLTVPNLSTFGDLVEDMATGALGGGTGSNPDVHRETDQTSVRSLIGALRDHGVPDVQVVYFPGIDLFTHQAEDPLRSQRRYLAAVTDSAVARVVEAYREMGALDDTYLLFVSDHGHVEVIPDDRHSLGTDGDDEPPALLRRAGFRVRPAALHTDADDYQAVLAYQGAVAFVYLADRSTCPDEGDRCDWSLPPRPGDDVLAAAAAFHRASQDGELVPELRGTLDMVLVRDPDPAAADPYRVYHDGTLRTLQEHLRDDPRPDLVRFRERLRWLGRGPRAHLTGDLVLLARSGAARPLEDRFYFASPAHSEHGGASAQESVVPLVVAHPARTADQLRVLVAGVVGDAPSQLDVTPLILRLLGR